MIADPLTHLAPCGLVEDLPATSTSPDDCKVDKGRRFLKKRSVDGKDRIVCQINQLGVDKTLPSCSANEESPLECLTANQNPVDDPDNPRITGELVGWYYDDFSAALKDDQQCNQQRIAFTKGAEQARGSEVRFECLQPVFSVFANPLGVEAVNKPCAEDPDLCDAAQTDEFPSVICDGTRNTCQIQCEESANCPDGWVCDATSELRICVNPTCPPQ